MKVQIVRVQRWGEGIVVDDDSEAHLQSADQRIAARLAEDDSGWFEAWRPAPDKDWVLGRRIDCIADEVEVEIIGAAEYAQAGRWEIRWALLAEIMLMMAGWAAIWWGAWWLIRKWTGHG